MRRPRPAVLVPSTVVILTAGALLAGCRPGAPAAPAAPAGGCLPLPGTARASLRLAPDGRALYWHERVAFYGYRSTWPALRVARWELGAAAAAEVVDGAGAPFRVLGDGAVVAVGESGVVVARAGNAELVSAHDRIEHLEVLADGATAIYLAAGALWRQPLHRVAARRLAAAEALAGLDGDRVVYWRDGALWSQPAGGGVERAEAVPDGELVKVLDGAAIVVRADGVAVQPLAGGPARLVLPGTWEVRPAPDGVRAIRKDGARIEAAIVTAAGADRLPGVRGGADLVGFVRLPDRRVAYLIGHDTDGDGELTTGDEDDLCVGPADAPLAVTPRTAPLRLAAAAPALDRLAADLGLTRWRVSGLGEVPLVTFEGGDRRHDQARRWADVGRVGLAVAAATGDPALNVVIEYGDGGRALSEWDASAGARVRWAGTGIALVPDPASYALELQLDTLTRDDDGLVTCAGSLTSRADRPLTDLVIDCVGGDVDIPVPVFPRVVAPGQTARFSGTTAGDPGGVLVASVHRLASGETFLAHEPARAGRYARIAAAAATVLDRTRLTLWDWSGGAEVTLELWAPRDFGEYSSTARELAAALAHELLARVDRADFLGAPDAALVLTIHAGGATWTFDGATLTEGGGD